MTVTRRHIVVGGICAEVCDACAVSCERFPHGKIEACRETWRTRDTTEQPGMIDKDFRPWLIREIA